MFKIRSAEKCEQCWYSYKAYIHRFVFLGSCQKHQPLFILAHRQHEQTSPLCVIGLFAWLQPYYSQSAVRRQQVSKRVTVNRVPDRSPPSNAPPALSTLSESKEWSDEVKGQVSGRNSANPSASQALLTGRLLWKDGLRFQILPADSIPREAIHPKDGCFFSRSWQCVSVIQSTV